VALGSKVDGQFHITAAVVAENLRLVAGAATAISRHPIPYHTIAVIPVTFFSVIVRSTVPTDAVASALACTSHTYIPIVPGPRFPKFPNGKLTDRRQM